MKKILLFLTTIALTFSLAACSGETVSEGQNSTNSTSAKISTESSVTQPSTETSASASAENSETPSSSETNTASSTPVSSGDNTSEPESPDISQVKTLVVYFSATGNTKAVAETLAELINADIYEIVPEQPYTSEDLNYNNRDSRSTSEQNDKNARPAISGSITNLDQYDVIYVGYPIWWGDMPRILYTFFDSYDFGGKTIAPFCTSGGSGLSGTPRTIADLESGATVLDGLHVGSSSANNAQNSLNEWLASIGQAA